MPQHSTWRCNKQISSPLTHRLSQDLTPKLCARPPGAAARPRAKDTDFALSLMLKDTWYALLGAQGVDVGTGHGGCGRRVREGGGGGAGAAGLERRLWMRVQCSDAGSSLPLTPRPPPPLACACEWRRRSLPPSPLAAAPAPGAEALQALHLDLFFRWTHRAWPPRAQCTSPHPHPHHSQLTRGMAYAPCLPGGRPLHGKNGALRSPARRAAKAATRRPSQVAAPLPAVPAPACPQTHPRPCPLVLLRPEP